MRVAVTGASGFLGRHITGIGRAQGYDIVALGRSNAAMAQVDLLGAVDPIAKSLTGCDSVIHAAMPHSGTSRDITTMTENVCKAATMVGVGRLVYVSSIGVIDPGVADVTDDSPVDPMPEQRDAYARGKLKSEGIVNLWATTPGNIACIARPGPILGEGRWWSDRFGIKMGRRWIEVGNSPIPWIGVERCAERLIDIAVGLQSSTVRHLFEATDRAIIRDLITAGKLTRVSGSLSYQAARRANYLLQPLAWVFGKRSPGLMNLRRFEARFKPRRYA